jgi:hypothetical protein
VTLLQEHADRELLRQSEEIFRLACARLEKPRSDPSFLPRLILSAAEDRVYRDFPDMWDRSKEFAEKVASRLRPVASALTARL